MTWVSPKGSFSMNAYPKTLSWIAYSVLGLALFLTFASWVLVSYPIGSTVRGYFYGIDSSQKLELSISSGNQASVDPRSENNVSSNSSVLVPTNSSSYEDGAGEKLSLVTNSQGHPSSNGSGVVPESREMKDVPAGSVRTTDHFVDDSAKAINKSLAGDFVSQVPGNGSSLALETKETKDQEAVPPSSTGSLNEGNIEVFDKNSSSKPNSQLPVNSTDLAAPVLVPSSDSTQEDASSNVTDFNFVEMRSNKTTPSPSDSKSDAVPALSRDSDLRNGSSTGSVDSGSFFCFWVIFSFGLSSYDLLYFLSVPTCVLSDIPCYVYLMRQHNYLNNIFIFKPSRFTHVCIAM